MQEIVFQVTGKGIFMRKYFGFLLTFLILFSLIGCSHIEDTNGTDDHSLTTLTDEDFLKGHDFGVTTMSVYNTVQDMTSLSVKKLSGIMVLDQKIRASGEDLQIKTDAGLVGGNLRICVVRDNKEIVEEIDINGNDEICIENANGTYTIVIGGESAEFALTFIYRLTHIPE